MNQIRIPEQTDWVVFLLLACGALYLFMMISLQRDSTVREFILQPFAEASNGFVSWIVVSAVYILLFSTLISQYIPIVPEKVSRIQLFGLQLNKFGYTVIAVLFFYLIKTVLSFLFYESTGNGRRWSVFTFVSTKFYFMLSLLLMVLCVANYFYDIERFYFYQIILGTLAAAYIFKICFYLLNRNGVLPAEAYYKILYICTLQIAPVLVLWKLLFF